MNNIYFSDYSYCSTCVAQNVFWFRDYSIKRDKLFGNIFRIAKTLIIPRRVNGSEKWVKLWSNCCLNRSNDEMDEGVLRVYLVDDTK